MRLKEEADHRRVGMNALILQLVRKGVGLRAEGPRRPLHHDLDHLAGTWSPEEADGFLAATAVRLGDGLGRLRGGRFPFDSEALDKLLGWACYSPARLQAELGWAPRVALAEGLRGMLGDVKRAA